MLCLSIVAFPLASQKRLDWTFENARNNSCLSKHKQNARGRQERCNLASNYHSRTTLKKIISDKTQIVLAHTSLVFKDARAAMQRDAMCLTALYGLASSKHIVFKH